MAVAVKSLRKEALDSEREELLEEALVVRCLCLMTLRHLLTSFHGAMLCPQMAQMNHPNVVALIGVVTRGRPIYVVLGKTERGSPRVIAARIMKTCQD